MPFGENLLKWLRVKIPYYQNLLIDHFNSRRVMRKPAFCKCEKGAIQISTFVFATRKEQFLYILNPKFQATSHLQWPHSLVCVGPGWKSRRQVFPLRGPFAIDHFSSIVKPSHEKPGFLHMRKQRHRSASR